MISAVVFDLDDTIYNYKELHEVAINKVFTSISNKYRFDILEVKNAFEKSKNEVHDCLCGTGAMHNRSLYFLKTYEKLGITPLTDSLISYEEYWDYILANMKCNLGVIDFLKYLNKRKIKIGICTDLTCVIQLKKIKQLNIELYIDAIVTSEEVGEEKPSSKMYELICKKLKTKKKDILYIGDSLEKDYYGPSRYGMNSILYSNIDLPHIHSFTDFEEVKEMLYNGE